ncbi:probable disease resistance RPP8-like protein 2 [Magnolia sinica]|uniref:probable disease resistance RPP8-like protein 2 n=1 Tax=Magnolia sinica TaxID=86752 RepID=UPI002658B424|nr:probable disease resistance RPP8-like protein 2 [Magnolia sinica]
MIGEAVVSFVIEKLGDLLIHEGVFLHEVRDQIEWVEAELRSMRAFLKDADAKQKVDERVKNWVADVRDAAYDAEDVIDGFLFKIEQKRRRGSVGFIKRFTGFSDEIVHRRELGKEIEQIKNKLLDISRRRSTYSIEDLGEGGEGSGSMDESLREQRRTSHLLEEPEIVGFQDNIETLVARLIKGERRRCVISVVGMGGLGKTTLAMKVYNNEAVRKHFNCCAWIYVSQEYNARDLLLSIVRCFKSPTKKELEMGVFQLRERLSEHLKKMIYFVVVDDIWKTDAWDVLAPAFPDMNNGSRVLLTTRNRDIASYADARSHLHEMQLLGKDDSWELFCKKTFLGQHNNCPQDLDRLGREIVAKCHGLPLAIVIIGGLLSRKARLRSVWEKVLKSISWQFVEGEAQISRILALSYEDLPYYLKPCFLYVGVFPEDYEISARKLIQLWVAEGFVPSRGAETLEEVAEDCLDELIQRSLIQMVKRSSVGRVKSCRIHDLLRELSISKAKGEKFLYGDVDSLSPCKARRLSVHRGIRKHTSINRCLRSFLCFSIEYAMLGKQQQQEFLYRHFELLRVLHLQQVEVEEFPTEIITLTHLRYLHLKGSNQMTRLPSSIANLCNLQTLEVSVPTKLKRHPSVTSNLCNLQSLEVESNLIYIPTHNSWKKPQWVGSNLIDIPIDIWKMQQLRHVCVRGRIIGEGSKGGLSCSSNLQTLATIEAGDWIDDSLRKLVNLRKLGISGLDLFSHAKGLSESLTQLDHLQSLKLELVSRSTMPESSLPSLHQLHLYKLHLNGSLKKLPKSHEFSPNLTKLTLEKTRLQQDPMSTLEKLTSLRILRLLANSYEGKEMVCSAQGFPRLEHLNVDCLRDLEEWRVEEGAMPRLLHLLIDQCEQLKKLPEGLQHVTALRELTLLRMDYEFISRLREEDGEDWHKIRHIPSIEIQRY